VTAAPGERDRDQRCNDDDDRHDAEVVLDDGDIAKEKAAPDEQRHPGDPADAIMELESPVTHAADSGNEWREGTHDRHVARQDDGLAAVAIEEFFRAPQVLDLQKAHVAAERTWPDGRADRVVGAVAENRGRRQQQPRVQRIQRAARIHRRKRTHREQQRIARQERRHDQPRLGKDDQKQDCVDPGVESQDQLDQVAVEMEDEVDEVKAEVDDRLQQLHAAILDGASVRWR